MQERSIATRHAILDAASRVFDRKGFTAASIAEILEEAKLTKGALYFHFSSKEQLAEAIVGCQLDWLDPVPPAGVTALQHLIDLSFRFATALQEDPLIRASIRLTLERNTFGARVESPYQAWDQVVTQLLEAAQSAGDLSDVAPREAISQFVTSAFTGVQLTSEALFGRADLLERLTRMWQILLPAIATPEAVAHLDDTGASSTTA